MSENEPTHESEAPPAITDAAPPFDKSSPWGADAILRSSDNIDFRVLKALLYPSPIFKTTFSLPREPQSGQGDEGGSMAQLVDDIKDDLPIVRLPESGEVLYRLLHLCYPSCATTSSSAAKMHTVDDVRGLLEVALKYEMEEVERRVREELVSPRFLTYEPFRVFTLAMRHGFEVEARVAARSMLVAPIDGRPLELDDITAGDFLRLQDYRDRCAEAVCKVTTDLLWIGGGDWVWFKCKECKPSFPAMKRTVTIAGGWQMPVNVNSSWWAEYMGLAAKALTKKPVGATVLGDDLMDTALAKAGKCDTCRLQASPAMRKFGALFAAEVDRISEVWNRFSSAK
jgi:hypothetical protein